MCSVWSDGNVASFIATKHIMKIFFKPLSPNKKLKPNNSKSNSFRSVKKMEYKNYKEVDVVPAAVEIFMLQ